LEWLVAVTVAFCSEHSPGPGLAVTAFLLWAGIGVVGADGGGFLF